MADTPAQAALRAALNSKLSVIPQTLSQEKQTQAQTNIGGPFLPLSGGSVSGTITATGFKGPLAGNASTASKWATARTITLSGDATGAVSFNGSANATLNLTIANGSVTNVMLAAGSVTFSKVANTDVATQAEAEAGTANNSFMTPLRVAQAIAAQRGAGEAYIARTYNNGNGNLYRIWSDGYKQQIVYVPKHSGQKKTVSLLIQMRNTSYAAFPASLSNQGNDGYASCRVMPVSTNSVDVVTDFDEERTLLVVVEGY